MSGEACLLFYDGGEDVRSLSLREEPEMGQAMSETEHETRQGDRSNRGEEAHRRGRGREREVESSC